MISTMLQSRGSLSSGLAVSLMLSLGAGGALAQAAAQQEAVESQTLIVGSVAAHGFQSTEPDDEGVAVDPREVNFRSLFEGLGEDAALWYQHVLTLSNPFFEGRQPGLAGNERAAEYIEFYFRLYGFEPAFPDEAIQQAGTDEEPGGALAGNWTTYRQPFAPRDRAELGTENVGGVLRGRGHLADQWIVIGAHFDHVGYGRPGAQDGPLHPGADDNASGTSGMLILARRFAKMYAEAGDEADLRSILFLGFSAEEMGLLGSQHYVRNSTLDAEDIQIMINLDMIGRLRDDTILLGGVGTAEGLLETIKPHLTDSGLIVHADPTGRGPSDHQSFYNGGVPVLFMFTGTHESYHRPGDQGYTVNPIGALKVIDMTWDIAQDMATRGERLVFSRPAVDERPAREVRRGPRASLGFLPDFDAEAEIGIVIGEVTDGGAAGEAGLQAGDIITAWDGDLLVEARTLFQKLRDASPGDEVELTVKRGAETKKVKVTLQSRGG